jgi:hypothetical protein
MRLSLEDRTMAARGAAAAALGGVLLGLVMRPDYSTINPGGRLDFGLPQPARTAVHQDGPGLAIVLALPPAPEAPRKAARPHARARVDLAALDPPVTLEPAPAEPAASDVALRTIAGPPPDDADDAAADPAPVSP